MADTKRPVKVPKLDTGEDDEDSNHKKADEKAQAALEKIVGIQNEIDRLNEQASEEILRVEQKYNQLRKPHYANRAKLANEIPEFWYTTFINHPAISELLNDDDEQALQYLVGLSVDEFEDVKSGFKISMYFKNNPYFQNEVLCKEYILNGSGESTVTGTDIEWMEGKDLTKRSQPEGNSRKRPLEEPSSIFCWFDDCNEADDIAEIIKDDIWPNPLQFFLQGEVSVEEDEEDDEEEDEDDELVDLDEDDEDVDDAD